MWFEGTVRPDDIPKLMEKLMTTPDAKGTPMWEMISSNIGTTYTDDGYIFKSTGETGKDNILLGFNPFYYVDNVGWWHEGHYFFVMHSYTPGAPGQNGVSDTKVRQRPRYHYDASFNGGTKDKILLKYYISVNRNRVIMVFSNEIASNAIQSVRSVLYMGLINRYSDEKTSDAVCIASSYDHERNNYNAIYMLRGGNGRPMNYAVQNEKMVRNNYGQRTDGKFGVFNLPVRGTSEGVRGELDGMLMAPFYSSSAYQNASPQDGDVIIDGKEYVAARKKYYNQSEHDNFAPFPDGNVDFVYYIEKK